MSRRICWAIGVLAFNICLASAAFAGAAAANPPTVIMGTVDDVGYSTAKVTGELDAGGFAVYSFEYSSNGVDWAKAGEPFSFGSGLEEVSTVIEHLRPSTTYSFRLSALNEANEQSVTAAPYPEATTLGPVPAPTVTLDPVTAVTDASARFVGHIDPGAANTDPGFNVRWHFVCEPSCLGIDEDSGEFNDDGTSHQIETEASVEPNQPYTIKLFAENAGGEAVAQGEFTTLGAAPFVETISAFALGDGTEALIGGKVNPKNAATEYWFEYGPGPGGPGATYPSTAPVAAKVPVGSGGQRVFVTQKIDGLSPGSTYHFRLVAQNASGATDGEDLSFATPAPPAPTACGNGQLRAETGSTALPECRAYELVSPTDKNGGDIVYFIDSSPTGNRAAFTSPTGFPGASSSNSLVNAYVAERTVDGWRTGQVQQPHVIQAGLNGQFFTPDFNEDLTESVTSSRSGAPGQAYINNIFLSTLSDSTWISAPTIPLDPAQNPIPDKNYSGRSADLSRIFFESRQDFSTETTGGSAQVWEWHDGHVQLVSVMPGGGPTPEEASLGSGHVNDSRSAGTGGLPGYLPQRHVVSADGHRAFFSLGADGHGVFVREDGDSTRRLDLSQRAENLGEPPPDGAYFVEASSDGAIVLFRSVDRLTEDAPLGGGLYAYDLEEDRLRLLIPTSPGMEFIQMSLDGSRVYFIDSSVLVPGRGVEGAKNIYVSEGDDVRFIATVAPVDAGEMATLSLHQNVQATADGRYFAFTSGERLTAYDNEGHAEVYRYDASMATITCVSCSPDGGPATGDAATSAFAPRTQIGISQYGRGTFVTPNGAVLFQTTAALVPRDRDGVADVYLYKEGRVSLISSGAGSYDSLVGGMSRDEKNVFFMTRDSLVGQDIDTGSRDVYDARVEGGYPAPVGPTSCADASACQEVSAGAPPSGFSATADPLPGNRVRRVCRRPSATHKAKRCPSKRKKRRHRHRSSHPRHRSGHTSASMEGK